MSSRRHPTHLPPRATGYISALSLLLLGAGLAPDRAEAQDHDMAHHQPYAGLETREIKALSQEDMDGLLAGEGMGLALAAELNGYPGPKHVLELAEELQLTDEQREEVEAVFASMQSEARRLGAEVVQQERALDRAFVDATLDADALRERTLAIGALQGELRAVHLAAHLRMVEILSAHQRHHYQVVRGYASH